VGIIVGRGLKQQLAENWMRLAACLLLVILAWPTNAAALGSQQNPQSGSVGVQGKLAGPPPSSPPTIAVPGSGQGFNSIPITVSGLCKSGLIVKIFDNGVFDGATSCSNGSYSLKITLFGGTNDLIARQYDALDQASPPSPKTTVTFNDLQLIKFGTHVFLTSDYASRGAGPKQTLDWPVIITGGIGPYALSADWGDGSASDLKSIAFPGTVQLAHTYASSGTYNMLVRATDKNGTEAFLQLVAVVNGNGAASASPNNNTTTNNSKTKVINVLWEPLAAAVPFVITTFWLGRRYEITALRRRIEREYRA
jgi:hypothetical protein